MDSSIKYGDENISTSGQSLIKGSVTGERFVIFMDIMGFKDRVARNSHEKILKDLQQLSNHVVNEIEKSGNFFFTMFSDSIIIFSKEVSAETFSEAISLSSSVIKKSISLGLPIKGAIAKGICTTIIHEKMLFFGQPIIDSYTLEENVELYNVVLHNTVEEYASNLNVKNLIFDCEVKLKGGVSNHYVLTWFAHDKDEAEKELKKIRMSVSGAPRRYIDNTIKCIHAYI